MKRNRLVFLLAGFFILVRVSIIYGQELNTTQQKYLEEVVERISESNGDPADPTPLFDELHAFMKQPLDLNYASRNEFEQLHILNDFQIASLIEYRNVHGPVLSIYELLYIPGFRQVDIELLQSFVIVGGPIPYNSESVRNLKGIENLVVFRYQRILEKQSGYALISDSVLQNNPDKSRILGSPDKLYARYNFSSGRHLTAGLLAEKDAGEEFFSGSNRQGFDLYSMYLAYKNDKSVLRRIIVGDYHIQAGQGVLLWSGFAAGKSCYIDQLPRRSAFFKSNNSANEDQFLRGVAIEFGRGNFNMDLFTSCKAIDASLADSVVAGSAFESFRVSGIHTTSNEIKAEKSVFQTTFGIGLNYKGNRFSVGLNGYYTSFSKTLLESDKLYKSYAFHGNNLIGMSINYLYLGRRFQLFGESANGNGDLSLLNGMLIFLNQNILLGAIHRYYNTSYYSYYANAFAEGSSVNNERGLFFGSEIRFLSYTLKTYTDIFTFPWLKYSLDAPSTGNDFFIDLSRKFSKLDLYCRYRRREIPENFDAYSGDLRIGILRKDQFRLNIQFRPVDYLAVQNRFELIQSANSEETKHYGFLLLQDINLKSRQIPINHTFRIVYFNTSDYTVRLYAYEKDVRFAYTNNMHYGRGWRFMLLTKWQPKTFFTLWIRIAQSFYPGRDSIGSGLSEIMNTHKTEIKLQTMIRF